MTQSQIHTGPQARLPAEWQEFLTPSVTLHRRSDRKKAMTMKVDRKEFVARGYLYRPRVCDVGQTEYLLDSDVPALSPVITPHLSA